MKVLDNKNKTRKQRFKKFDKIISQIFFIINFINFQLNKFKFYIAQKVITDLFEVLQYIYLSLCTSIIL